MPGTQCWDIGDRKVPEAHRPLRLAKWVSPKFSEKPCVKKVRRVVRENTWHGPLSTIDMNIYIYVYCIHVSTHIHTQRSKQREQQLQESAIDGDACIGTVVEGPVPGEQIILTS